MDTRKRVPSGNLNVPAVVGMTWNRFRDQSELDRIRTHAARIIQDLLDEPGFISIVTGAAGDHAFTVHASENEAAIHNALEKSHSRAKLDFVPGTFLPRCGGASGSRTTSTVSGSAAQPVHSRMTRREVLVSA
jgi:hypothetical protein